MKQKTSGKQGTSVSGSAWLPTIHRFCFATSAPRKFPLSTGRRRNARSPLQPFHRKQLTVVIAL
jgi:hypothetical protein